MSENLDKSYPGLVEASAQFDDEKLDNTPPGIIAGDETNDRHEESRWQWLKRQQVKIALGATAVSTALTFTNEFDELKHKVIEVGPYVGPALGALEIGWIGGAALMLAGVGSKIGNPLKFRSRIPEISRKANESTMFKSGLAINMTSSVGESLLLGGAIVTELPPEAWGSLSLLALNLGSDFVLTKNILRGMKEHSVIREIDHLGDEIRETKMPVHELEKKPDVRVRKANLADAERMAEIDLSRYKRVYGENPPSKEEATNIFTHAIENAGPGWTYVCEVDGKTEGLVNAFRTNKSMDEFVSWEDCTADGTLDGRVDPNGKYVYAANLTVNPNAMKCGGEDMLIANLMAQAIQEGIEYGYFISRMPIFSAWVKRQTRLQNVEPEISPETLDDLAYRYANTKEVIGGKEVRIDHELRMYEELGFKIGRVVRNGFQDPQSMNYGVLCKVDVPPKGVMKKSKLVRGGLATGLRLIAKSPKVLEKTFA